MENKEFNKEKFYTELFDNHLKSINNSDRYQDEVLKNIYDIKNLNKSKSLEIFFDKNSYEKDYLSGFKNYCKKFLNSDEGKFYITGLTMGAPIFAILGTEMFPSLNNVQGFVSLLNSELIVGGLVVGGIMMGSKIINKIDTFFNKEQKFFKNVENIAINKLNNDLKDYSIEDLKNLDILKKFKLNEINNNIELKKKIKEIFKNNEKNFAKEENPVYKNDYFLTKNILNILNQKIDKQENTQKANFFQNLCNKINNIFKNKFTNLNLTSARNINLDDISIQANILNNLVKETNITNVKQPEKINSIQEQFKEIQRLTSQPQKLNNKIKDNSFKIK